MSLDLKSILRQLNEDIANWEQEHFGDDTQAKADFYRYCLNVAMGIEQPTTLKQEKHRETR